MQLTTIHTGYFKLDGGAMFGVVPKKIWQKLNPPDENNLATWSMRCLLVETENRKILIDTGLGNKQDAKFFGHYEPSGPTLTESLNGAGIALHDITDVFFTHLHFDHCGGAIIKNSEGALIPAFENATYWSNKKHWDWAINPNAREKASFLSENILPIEASQKLRFIHEHEDLVPGFSTIWVYGHTEAMMLPVIDYKGTKIIYCADLLASAAHIPLPYVMAYDMRPLSTLSEKEAVLKLAAENDYVLYFEHDKDHEAARVHKTEKGYALKEFVDLQNL